MNDKIDIAVQQIRIAELEKEVLELRSEMTEMRRRWDRLGGGWKVVWMLGGIVVGAAAVWHDFHDLIRRLFGF